MPDNTTGSATVSSVLYPYEELYPTDSLYPGIYTIRIAVKIGTYNLCNLSIGTYSDIKVVLDYYQFIDISLSVTDGEN